MNSVKMSHLNLNLVRALVDARSKFDLVSTRARTRLGRVAEANYVISASFPHIPERLRLLSLSFLNPSRRFRTFGREQNFRVQILPSIKIWTRK